jgi:hypothetical protein
MAYGPLSSPAPTASLGSDGGRVVDAWCAEDHAHAFLEADHGVIERSRSLRALVVERATREPTSIGRDVLHAFASLGRVMAEQGGSPTLAASSIDGLITASRVASEDSEPARDLQALATAGRAAMMEGYVHALGALAREHLAKSWAYPACAVPLQDGLVAIAAGHPADDDEALAAWASQVAHGVTRAGARRAIACGPEKAVKALEEALDLAGVERLHRLPAIPVSPRPNKLL